MICPAAHASRHSRSVWTEDMLQREEGAPKCACCFWRFASVHHSPRPRLAHLSFPTIWASFLQHFYAKLEHRRVIFGEFLLSSNLMTSWCLKHWSLHQEVERLQMFGGIETRRCAGQTHQCCSISSFVSRPHCPVQLELLQTRTLHRRRTHSHETNPPSRKLNPVLNETLSCGLTLGGILQKWGVYAEGGSFNICVGK